MHVLRNPKDVCVSAYHHTKTSMELGEIGDFKTFFDEIFMNPKGEREREREKERERVRHRKREGGTEMWDLQ